MKKLSDLRCFTIKLDKGYITIEQYHRYDGSYSHTISFNRDDIAGLGVLDDDDGVNYAKRLRFIIKDGGRKDSNVYDETVFYKINFQDNLPEELWQEEVSDLINSIFPNK
jgi:hypothetical protein